MSILIFVEFWILKLIYKIDFCIYRSVPKKKKFESRKWVAKSVGISGNENMD